MALMSMVTLSAYADTTLEAESAQYANCKLVADGKYSGGKALELTDDAAAITFTFSPGKAGKYVVYVGCDGLYGQKQVKLSVNGNASTFATADKAVSEVNTGTFAMNAEDNTIIITPSWTWFRIDYIRLTEAAAPVVFDVAAAPVDAQATEGARKLYALLHNNFGKKTIAGMQTGDVSFSNDNILEQTDIQEFYNRAGKYPALVGFDFMNATGKTAANNYDRQYTHAHVALAKDTWRRGGIPAFSWHWRDPSRATSEFYSDKNTVKISDAMDASGNWDTSSSLYAHLIQDIDVIADYFLEMQTEGVACLFRPLHEASGGWFWWGREDGAKCSKLWALIFDEMVNKKGVHNVVWVWNGGPTDADWLPDASTFDVASTDIYNEAYDYSSNYVAFDQLRSLTNGKKILALAENGPLPDVDKSFSEDAVWSWWMPWYHTWNSQMLNKTSAAQWKKVMSDSRIISLSDLSEGWSAIRNITESLTPTPPIYDLHGRQLPHKPARGIYIINGKKHF